jgi:hypothetical protein
MPIRTFYITVWNSFVPKIMPAYSCIDTKLIFRAPYQVGTFDISLNKLGTSSGADSNYNQS